jgi:hypothetical protein
MERGETPMTDDELAEAIDALRAARSEATEV